MTSKAQQLIEHLSEHIYAHARQIVAYIFERWAIKYTVSGLISVSINKALKFPLIIIENYVDRKHRA